MIKLCFLTFGPIADDFHRRAKRPFLAGLCLSRPIAFASMSADARQRCRETSRSDACTKDLS